MRKVRYVKGPMAKRIGLWIGVLIVGIGAAAFVLYRLSKGDERPVFNLRATIPSHGDGFASAIFQSVGTEIKAGHSIQVLQDGEIFPALAASIRGAAKSIHVVIYIWEKGKASNDIVSAIASRTTKGVRCNILVDGLTASAFSEGPKQALQKSGCQTRVFRPDLAQVTRNHRKIVIIDGQIAFTGGFGIQDNWLGTGRKVNQWRDTHVRFSGPAVLQAQQAFAENWQEAGGGLLPPEDFPQVAAQPDGSRAALVTSTSSPAVTRAERLSQLMIAAAKKRIWISNAYFVPSEAIRTLLLHKARQGVDVRILTSGKKSDSRTSFTLQQYEYDDLTRGGVRVWEYQPSNMHAKTMVVDDTLSVVGSINLEPLSLNKLEEVALVVDDRKVNATLATSFLRDLRHSHPIRD